MTDIDKTLLPNIALGALREPKDGDPEIPADPVPNEAPPAEPTDPVEEPEELPDDDPHPTQTPMPTDNVIIRPTVRAWGAIGGRW